MSEYTAATIVKVLRNVPLDSTYSDTIYFESIGAQTAYFEGKAKYTFGPTSYQRVNSSIASPRGPRSIRLPRVADDFYDCNYIMFQNASFGTKWFYGFITSVNYISPENTEILYELDYYQTYAFDFRILPSFIEREHSVTDELYHNLVPESFGTPEVIRQAQEHVDFGNYRIYIAYNADENEEPVPGEMASRYIYTGCAIYECSTADEANSFIAKYDKAGRASAIVAIYMSPFSTIDEGQGFVNVSRPVQLNGYIPKNQKLLTYPYTYLRLTNNSGEILDLKFENFAEYNSNGVEPRAVSLTYYVLPKPLPSAYMVPCGYLASGFAGSDTQVPNFDYVISLKSFPTCLWTNNDYANYMNSTYRNGVQKNLVNTLWNVVSGLGQTALGAAQMYVTGGTSGLGTTVGGIARTATSVISGKQQSAAMTIDAATKAQNPGQSHGSLESSDLNFVALNVGFDAYTMAIKPEMARMLDSYFDMYGYATNQVKMPNFTSRESWNYVKTADVMMDGSMPVEAMDTIKAIFNNGIRFWHGDYVGNYSRSNRCVADIQKDGDVNA